MIDGARRQLIDNIRISVAEQQNEADILRSAVELIDGFSEHFNWTGVYMMKNNLLHVGPYIGPKTEHTSIELDSGICGAAASKKETVVVDNVREDPRFIACSRTTRSEIVVPLLDGSTVLGEIDIDSNRPANFTSQDQQMLEEIAHILVQRLKDIQ